MTGHPSRGRPEVAAVSEIQGIKALPDAYRWGAMRAVILRELGVRTNDPALSAVTVDQRVLSLMQSSLERWTETELLDALAELNRLSRAARVDRWSDVTAEVLMLLDGKREQNS